MKRKIHQPPDARKPLEFHRADPAQLAKFDPNTKICTMNCGPHRDDPRTYAERKFLCNDCLANKEKAMCHMDGPDAPYPGMATAFEAHTGQSWTDPDWRQETAMWAAAWKAAKARPIGYCIEGDRCVCGGDTPAVRAGCANWVRPDAK